MHTFSIFAAMIIASLASPALAQSFESPSAIDAQIAAATGAAIGTPGGAATRVDPRLKLARCPHALLIEPPVSGAFAVRCAALGWRIRVPAVAAAAAARVQTIVIERGDAVDLVAGGPGFEVSTSAVAVDRGAAGSAIRVKLSGSASAITATVVAPGRVRAGD